MRDEILKADPVLGITLEEVVEEVSELGRGATGNPRSQAGIPLIELLEGLRRGGELWDSKPALLTRCA